MLFNQNLSHKSPTDRTSKTGLKKHIASDADNREHCLFMKDPKEVIRMQVT